ncbi:MAG TPA: helix-turn-helix domain-containing protein [Methanobacterium sp.]|nr:helix-turn-helix domain-containing protein [Methanobacterium sp.]
MLVITERDKRIFEWLFRVKYVTIEQLSRYMQMSKHAVYKRVEKLQKEGYLDGANLYGNRKYFSNGIKIRNGAKRKADREKVNILISSLEHHMKVTDFFLYLLDNEVKEEMIFTSRDVFRTRIGISDNRKRIYKVPDLVIRRDDQRLIAIEIELSRKNDDTLSQVFDNYILYTNYAAVYYVCNKKAVKNLINRTVRKKMINFIRAYDVSEFETEFIFRG